MWRRSMTIWASMSLWAGRSRNASWDPTLTRNLPSWRSSVVPTASSSDITACHSMLWLVGWAKIWCSVSRWRLSRCSDSGEDDILFPSDPCGPTLRHVLVVGVDGVRFDLLGPDTTPAIWTVVVVTDHGHLHRGGHGGREPEGATAWVAAARPGIEPGGAPPVSRPAPVAALVRGALGTP